MKLHLIANNAFLAIGLSLIASQGLAQGAACASHDAIVASLAERWGESRQSIGLDSNGIVVELFASEETGTWTITVTPPGGETCLVADGSDYQELNEELPPGGVEG